jgi:hypothetical protein
MIPMQQPVSREERRLVKILRDLGAQDRATLIAFAEFLAAGGAATEAPEGDDRQSMVSPVASVEPSHEPRPVDETPIAAIRRLRRVYPMLDPSELLHETSSLMASHLLQGRAVVEVIDELEALFDARYRAKRSDADGD